MRDYYQNLPDDKKQKRLDEMKEYSRRSRANKRIQQALKSTKDREKDAHAKWKQRYKK